MREPLYNQRFGDIYFSPDDGLAETRHVFLEGNSLPQRWKGKACFTIAETGFGTGLNFLAVWKLFEETAAPDQTLDFISCEMYPLGTSEIKEALEGWEKELGGRLARLLALYPLRVPGFHKVRINHRITLTLIFDDVNEALPRLAVPRGVDCWFLDGFAPSKNPQMWTETLYAQMARLSAPEASVSSFTVAGHVRRGLADAGFSVMKIKGFGRKNEMLSARYGSNIVQNIIKNDPKRIAVIGGGMAGTACAYVLGQHGMKVTIFEKESHLAAGASGNETGLFNPRFSAYRTPESDFYTAAYAQLIRTLKELGNTGFRQCGTLHLVSSTEKEKQLRDVEKHWGWHADHMQYFSAAQASAQAGIPVGYEALFLPDSGCVCPYDLCHAYAAGADVRLNSPVETLGEGRIYGEKFDAVILATAAAVKNFGEVAWLPVSTVRGQVSCVTETVLSAQLQSNICSGVFISAPYNGKHSVGATFQKWLADIDVKEEDHRENMNNLAGLFPEFAAGMEVLEGKAGLRAASRDHFPMVGQACLENGTLIPDVYLSVAYGSHGIISSLAGAHLLTDLLLDRPSSLSMTTREKLSPVRFPERERRKIQYG
ncbi:MAG: tRNA U-34 5-methylaminomethyl-2-thiouridine biosynthesis protein [Alphaproteobacteria bacterium CG_4_9_14_3_um_filter_47_13]|nr:MAG: tRNA U-34 5-methylaminomethyl-2-thiouridine biosynthesis protein [Alphaproteobacteria bacterium CG_4_9_14_3_um_filter_47_13]